MADDESAPGQPDPAPAPLETPAPYDAPAMEQPTSPRESGPSGSSGSPQPQAGAGRQLVEPRGYAIVSFLATAGIVIGVGMAPEGLFLAGAALVLSIIESRELMRLNPWIVPREGQDSPFSSKPVVGLMRVSFMTTVLASIVALLTVSMSGSWWAALPPAILAGIVNLALNHQLKLLLAKA